VGIYYVIGIVICHKHLATVSKTKEFKGELIMKKTRISLIFCLIVFSLVALYFFNSCTSSESEEIIHLPIGISSVDLGNGITLEIDTPVPIDITIITDTSGYPTGYQTVLVNVEGSLEAGQTVDITVHMENGFEGDDTLAFLNSIGVWEPVSSELSADQKSLSATVDHLSVWAIIPVGKSITSFDFLLADNPDMGFTGDVIGSVGATTINLQVPYGVGPYVDSLVPTIVHTGESVSPADGAAQDFTNPVTCTVTGINGTTKEYTVTVTVLPNDAKDITSFDFLLAENSGKGFTGDVIGSVNATTINLTVPYAVGPYVDDLVPNILHTGASVSPADGAGQDFTSPVTYTVTADDTTTKDYTVTVTVAPNDAKDITSFNFLLGENPDKGFTGNVIGTVGATTINLYVPYDVGPYVGSLVPNILHTGASVSPEDGAAQDFTSPVTYTVTADDTTTKDYTVTVTVAPSYAKNITSFDFLAAENSGKGFSGNVIGSFAGTTINLYVPYDVRNDVDDLVPNIVHTGASVSPADGVGQDFTSPVTYTVTAEDTTTKDYTVTVTVAPSYEKDITSFDFLAAENSGKGFSGNVIGSIAGTTINLYVPYDVRNDVDDLVPNIVHTGASVSPADGAGRNFTNPVTYTVTADDTTTKEYTVTVTVAPSYEKDITSFDFLLAENPDKNFTANVIGSVGGSTITLQVPYEAGDYVGNLVPNIVHTGESVSPADGAAQDFTNPVTYTVTADDTTTKDYTVTVTLDMSEAPAAHWKFDEGSGTSVGDSSGNNHVGTMYGVPSWIGGKVGSGALQFDGTNDYVEVGTNNVFNAQIFTVACWLYTPDGQTDFAYIRRVGGWFMRKWTVDNEWDVVIENLTSRYGVSSTQTQAFPDSQWHHYAVVVDNTTTSACTVTFYIDGVKIIMVPPDGVSTLNFPSSTGSLYIGQYDASYRWNGRIDDMRFYDEALSDSEIQALSDM